MTLVHVLPSALAPPVRIMLKPTMSFMSFAASVSLLAAVSVVISIRSMLSIRLFSSRPIAPTLLIVVKSNAAPPLKRIVSKPLPPLTFSFTVCPAVLLAKLVISLAVKTMVSLPLPAKKRSTPPPPLRVSLPTVPITASLPAVPVKLTALVNHCVPPRTTLYAPFSFNEPMRRSPKPSPLMSPAAESTFPMEPLVSPVILNPLLVGIFPLASTVTVVPLALP